MNWKIELSLELLSWRVIRRVRVMKRCSKAESYALLTSCEKRRLEIRMMGWMSHNDVTLFLSGLLNSCTNVDLSHLLQLNHYYFRYYLMHILGCVDYFHNNCILIANFPLSTPTIVVIRVTVWLIRFLKSSNLYSYITFVRLVSWAIWNPSKMM